jgi:hypothetical protein
VYTLVLGGVQQSNLSTCQTCLPGMCAPSMRVCLYSTCIYGMYSFCTVPHFTIFGHTDFCATGRPVGTAYTCAESGAASNLSAPADERLPTHMHIPGLGSCAETCFHVSPGVHARLLRCSSLSSCTPCCRLTCYHNALPIPCCPPQGIVLLSVPVVPADRVKHYVRLGRPPAVRQQER